MLHNCDTIIYVICNHPEDSSRYYTFGVDIKMFDDGEIRELIELEVNRNGYWHEVIIWSEVIDPFNDKMLYRINY